MDAVDAIERTADRRGATGRWSRRRSSRSSWTSGHDRRSGAGLQTTDRETVHRPTRSRSRTRPPAPWSSTIPILGAAELAELAATAREAQPQWAAIGFAGRARGHASRPAVDARQRRAGDRHRRLERPARPTRTRSWPTSATRRWRSGSGPSRPGEYLADERVPLVGQPGWRSARSSSCATSRTGWSGVIGPWNFPIVNGFGDCIPALMAGNSGDPQAVAR